MKRAIRIVTVAGAVLGAALSCGGNTDTEGGAQDSGSPWGGDDVASSGDDAHSGGHDSASGDDSTQPPGDAASDAPVVIHHACNDPPPPGAPQAAPLPTYAGQCPTLVAAPAENTITSSGASRQFMLAIPANVKPGETLPVAFMWHWIGGSASSVYGTGEVQQAVDTQRFLAVIPEAKGDLKTKWPFTVLDSDGRMAEEYQFFDDMLACVAAQFAGVNKNCVASAGVSAGGLFGDQLAAARADRIASFESLSGGVGGGFVRDWQYPARKLPALVLWGGPTDQCTSYFSLSSMSQNLEAALTSQGNFLLECVHNCGHAIPPFTSTPRFAPLWDFMFDHPFWLAAGQSPYQQNGLPADFPSWCAIGQGKATPRTGACTSPSAC